MIDVRRLRALRELDRQGTIASAANALSLTGSAVSQQLAALEREVGRPLMEPAGRSVRLTPTARVLLDHADALFAQLERLDADLAAQDSAGGDVRVSAFATGIRGIIAPAAVRLRATAPAVRLLASEREAPLAFRALDADETDIVISMEHDGAPQAGDARILRRDLFLDVLDAALPEDHPLADQDEVDLSGLGHEPWILPPVGWTCDEVARSACHAVGFTPRAVHRTGDWMSTLALVAAGLGVALIPRLAGLDAPEGAVLRPLRGVPPGRQLFAACRRGAEEHPAIAAALTAIAHPGGTAT